MPENSSPSYMNTVIRRVIELYRSGQMSFDDIKCECKSMVFAAFETTALTVFHTLLLLAMFPHYQDLVFEELKEFFPPSGDFDVIYEDLKKLEYLDRVLNETLRLIPSVPFTPRDITEDFRLSNGVLVPKGVVVSIDIFGIHRNKDFWGPEANKFNPDNFLPENVLQRHPFAFIPFSKGRRNCIGLFLYYTVLVI